MFHICSPINETQTRTHANWPMKQTDIFYKEKKDVMTNEHEFVVTDAQKI